MHLNFLQKYRHNVAMLPSCAASLHGLDYHNHLLPGVDDGVIDVEEARTAIESLQGLGFSGAVITPHIYRGTYDNSPQLLRQRFREFQFEINLRHAMFPLFIAAEYFADEYMLEQIEKDDLLFLTVGRERWVLVEFPYHHEEQYGAICMSALAVRGYRPVIAHVERYAYVARGRTVWLNRFARADAILQADIGSLVGQHGDDARRFCKWLLAQGLIKLWGSDLHHPEQVEKFIRPGLKQLSAIKRLNLALDEFNPGINT